MVLWMDVRSLVVLGALLMGVTEACADKLGFRAQIKTNESGTKVRQANHKS